MYDGLFSHLRYVGALGTLSVYLMACGGVSSKSKMVTETISGNALPREAIELSRQSYAGEEVKLSTHRGRVVVLTYFSTWCAPCVPLVSLEDRLAYGKKPVKGMVSLPISVDRNAKTVLKRFAEDQRIRGPLLLPTRAELRGRTPFGRIVGVPTTFIIDPTGRAVERLVGDVPAAYLRRRILSLMEAKK
jgi:peroxiredoxin